ncbi:hypothetical protein GF351_01460 [Candidatus Woesearchaeota archaeon]|nr:hypothetical protein [Candidatus Woesearchaeota archaeon]
MEKKLQRLEDSMEDDTDTEFYSTVRANIDRSLLEGVRSPEIVIRICEEIEKEYYGMSSSPEDRHERKGGIFPGEGA